MSHEKQNEAVFDIIHWQIIDKQIRRYNQTNAFTVIYG